MGKLHTVGFIVLLCVTIQGCTESSNTSYAYQEQCVGKFSNGECSGKWEGVRPYKYVLNFDKQEVVMYIVGAGLQPSKYSCCTIADNENWYCEFCDHSGSFGFTNGEYWERPKLLEDTRTVSAFKHYLNLVTRHLH